VNELVFVFGIDIPLVELVFILTLGLITLCGLLVYIIVKQHQLNQRIEKILGKENLELSSLKMVAKEEKIEANLLRAIRAELDKLVYGEAYHKGIKTLMKLKDAKAKKTQIRKLADEFWNEIIELSKKNKKTEKKKEIKQKPVEMTLRTKLEKISKPKL
jgi:hypothetical protein